MLKHQPPRLGPLKPVNSDFTDYRKKHPDVGTAEVTVGYIREFLTHVDESLEPNPRARLTGRTRLERMLQNIVATAESPSHPLAVQAFNAVCDRAWGKVKPSDAELGAIKGQVAFQVVYVDQTTQDPEIPLVEQKALKPVPEFIESEVVEDE